MLADPVLRCADIQACCSCLGFREGDVYKVDTDAEASIRALLRYLRNESSNCDVRRELGRLRILSSDLIPLLRSCVGNKTLTELTIRLLVNLTQPAIICFRQEVPKDRDLYGAYAQVDDLLRSYKKDFANSELFSVLRNLVGELLDRKWEERSEDDRLLIERVLILIRNVLHITPDYSEEGTTDDSVSVHDQLLWNIHVSGWDELLLFLGNAEDEQMFAFHTLEIISLMFREQTPELLASAGSSEATKMSEAIRRRWATENALKRQVLCDIYSRQNRFGGTYELRNTSSLSDRPLIYHHSVTGSLDNCGLLQSVPVSEEVPASQFDQVGLVNLDVDKRTYHKPKNRKPLIERPMHRRSTMTIQLYLQKFCWRFLQFCYNPLMKAARASLSRRATQENDETYYLWSMRFFMAFCRLYKFRSSLLSETLSASTFHWIYDQVMHYREVLFSDKRGGGTNRRAVQASRRLELAVAAYREFLTCLGRMLHPTAEDRIPDASVDESGEILEERLRVQSSATESIMANVFYVSEYQEVYPMLLRDFNEAVQSREYLRNLIEGAHLFISLLSERMGSADQKLIVRRRKVIRRKRQRRSSAKATRRQREQPDEMEEQAAELRALRVESQWSNQLCLPLIHALEPSLSDSSMHDEDAEDEETSRLFDAASGSTETKQQQSAIRRVQAALLAGEPLLALKLARRLWRLWPEVAPVTVEDDDPILHDERASGLSPSNLAILGALRQIHATEFEDQSDSEETDSAAEVDGSSSSEGANSLLYEEMELDNVPDGGDTAMVVTEKEIQMDLNAFLMHFAHPRIVYAFGILLAEYASNSRSTNLALVHLMHRLAVRLKLPGSLFQLRLFYVFQQFLHDASVTKLEEYKELVTLIKYILRKFFEAQQKNNAVLIELLFYKNAREAYEAVNGYGTSEDVKKSSKWNPELDEELTKLFEAYRHDPVPRDQDLADVLAHHLSDASKTRRQIIARLIALDLISSAKQLRQLTVRAEDDRQRAVSRRSKKRPLTQTAEDEVMRLHDQEEDIEHIEDTLGCSGRRRATSGSPLQSDIPDVDVHTSRLARRRSRRRLLTRHSSSSEEDDEGNSVTSATQHDRLELLSPSAQSPPIHINEDDPPTSGLVRSPSSHESD